jgi:hypothetical protein
MQSQGSEEHLEFELAQRSRESTAGKPSAVQLFARVNDLSQKKTRKFARSAVKLDIEYGARVDFLTKEQADPAGRNVLDFGVYTDIAAARQ